MAAALMPKVRRTADQGFRPFLQYVVIYIPEPVVKASVRLWTVLAGRRIELNVAVTTRGKEQLEEDQEAHHPG